MKKIYFLLFILISLRGQAKADIRLEKNIKAQAALDQLNFFSKGRGMTLPPGLISVPETVVYVENFLGIKDTVLSRQRWGLIRSEKGYRGLFDEKYKGKSIGVLGCVFCHGGKAAGKYYYGLGNKNVDVGQIGKDLLAGLPLYQASPLGWFGLNSQEDRELYNNNYEFAKRLANPQFSNQVQGLVPISMIRYWFYKNAGEEWPSTMGRGAVKVPQLWGYGEKRKVGQFSGGEGNGNFTGWGIAVEVSAGQLAENVLDADYQHKLTVAEDLLGDLLPPRYPFNIDQKLAQKGRAHFEQICLRCHGDYERDAQGYPIYKEPKHIPLRVVKTDGDRLKDNNAKFYELVENNPLKDIIKANHRELGYFAPRLDGIWARFPYFHNGSAPNLYQVLTAPEERIEVFSLLDAGEEYRFDKQLGGLTIPERDSKAYQQLLKDKERNRSIYDTSKVGQSNKGHDFYYFTHEEKLEVIEYLKTL